MLEVVNKSVGDNARRRRNVIVSGLHEPDDQSCFDADSQSFTELCRSQLYLDIGTNIVFLKRIGKRDGVKPRRLLIVLSSENLAQEILSRARNLRDAGDTHNATSVFINRDLSPEESRVAFEKRQTRRASGQMLGPLPCTVTPLSSEQVLITLTLFLVKSSTRLRLTAIRMER